MTFWGRVVIEEGRAERRLLGEGGGVRGEWARVEERGDGGLEGGGVGS